MISEIENNLALDTTTKPNNSEIYKTYTFLKQKGYINSRFDTFSDLLQGLPKPPPHALWIKIQNLQEKLSELKSELKLAFAKTPITNDWPTIPKWIVILLLVSVYPIRFIIILLIWSIQILKKQ